MANLKLDLSQDYATQMLSFYLWGTPTPPKASELVMPKFYRFK